LLRSSAIRLFLPFFDSHTIHDSSCAPSARRPLSSPAAGMGSSRREKALTFPVYLTGKGIL
jgi:hypothetical protein